MLPFNFKTVLVCKLLNSLSLYFRKTRELAKELNDKAIEAQVCFAIHYVFFVTPVCS